MYHCSVCVTYISTKQVDSDSRVPFDSEVKVFTFEIHKIPKFDPENFR